jgi:hypothetical protein
MSIEMYIFQTFLISSALLLVVRHNYPLLRYQVLVWMVGVIGLASFYGFEDQLGFYSNDQFLYVDVVSRLLSGSWPTSLSWWLGEAKAPFTLAAAPLVLMGINEALALKTVSLVSLLALSNSLISRSSSRTFSRQLQALFLTGCGLIGSFYSVLALRETMMMLFVFRFATARSFAIRILTVPFLYLLRPHLAAVLVLAEILVWLWQWMTDKRRIGAFEAPLLVTVGVIVGDYLYSWAFQRRTLGETPPFWDWGISEVTRIASNFVGLQFLTNDESKLRLSVSELLLLRLVLSETLLIPTGMILLMLFFGHRLRKRHQFTLMAFSLYVSIATNTDFNSFRQNIPLMPLMGLVILDAIEIRRAKLSSRVESSTLTSTTHLATVPRGT